MISGSDHYVGEMTLNSTTDLYVMNPFMEAVHGPDQPTTSLEFEVGSGDYGGGIDSQFDPSTVDLKTRLFVGPGQPVDQLLPVRGRGQSAARRAVGRRQRPDRFTGERHGTAAPVGPEGQTRHDVCSDRPDRARRGPTALARPHARGAGQRSQLGLVLDAYATEYRHPGSAVMTIIADLIATGARGRGGAGPLAAARRYRFGAVTWLRDAPGRRGLELADRAVPGRPGAAAAWSTSWRAADGCCCSGRAARARP